MRIFGYTDPASHALMVLDAVRTEAYARAIAAIVRPGDVVLDVGSGSGILALLAARAGARKVYAVEASGAVELVRAHVAENAAGGVVEVLQADLAELDVARLREPPDVVVSEILGHFAPEEHQHRVFQRARRLAAPDARLIPACYRMVFAPARLAVLEAELERLADVGGVSLLALQRKMRARAAPLRVSAEELVGPETAGATIAVDAPLPEQLTGRVTVTRPGPVTHVLCAFVATLAPGIELSSAPSAPLTHWQPVAFPVYPHFMCAAGDLLEVAICPRLVSQRGTWTWRVARGAEVRYGDAMQSFVGDATDMLAELGFRRVPAGQRRPSPRLDAWAAALGGTATEPQDMAARLLAALPERYADLADARQEVLALLAAAGALA